MEEQNNNIEVSEDQMFIIKEFQARITLAEVELQRLNKGFNSYLIEQGLAQPLEESDSALEESVEE